MTDPPSAAELIAAVRRFLEEQAMPALEGHTAFHARVAANALGIVERELRLAPAAAEREAERLRNLLEREGSLEELNRALCDAIRAGRFGLDTPDLVEHLRETTLDKLAVDQPRYSTHRLHRTDDG